MVPDGGPLQRPIFRPLPASRAVRNSQQLGGGQRQVRADRVDEPAPERLFMGPGVNADHGAYSRLMGQWRAGGVKRTVIVCGTRITRGPGEGPLAQLARVCARYQWSQCTTSSKGRLLGRASGRSGRPAERWHAIG